MQKACIAPLFEWKWGGIQHGITEVKKCGKGCKRKVYTDKSIGGVKSSNFVDDVKICTVRRYKSWADVQQGVGLGAALACGVGYIPCSETAKQTICVRPVDKETDCPITDMRLVWDKDYDAEALKGYKKAKVSGSDDLTWGLYYSKNTANLPISTVKLTQKKPCSLTNTYLSNPGQESANQWMSKDRYASTCSYKEVDSRMQESYRTMGSDLTLNELDLLTKTGALSKAATL